MNLWKNALVAGFIIFAIHLAWGKIVPEGRPLHFRNEAVMAHMIKENAPEDGVYHIRSSNDAPDSKLYPHFWGVVRRADSSSFFVAALFALVCQVAAAFAVLWAFHRTTERGFWPFVRFMTLAGAVIALGSEMRTFYWSAFSLGCTFLSFLGPILAWAFAGWIIAKWNRL